MARTQAVGHQCSAPLRGDDGYDNALRHHHDAASWGLRPISDERRGLITAIKMPDGGELCLYQPKHPTPTRPERRH